MSRIKMKMTSDRVLLTKVRGMIARPAQIHRDRWREFRDGKVKHREMYA
jgi:hypothetical protein